MTKYACILMIFITLACKNQVKETASENIVPLEQPGSDKVAVALADSILVASGGQEAWNGSKCFSWNFFGARKQWWNKTTGDVRIESYRTDLKVILNVKTMQGKVFVDGAQQTNPDTLKKYLEIGREMWLNDTYWLLLPFRLKDPGITLKYVGSEKMYNGKDAEVIEMFTNRAGVDEHFRILIDTDTYLIGQWNRYRAEAGDTVNVTTPWLDYRSFGKLKLSLGRGSQNGEKREFTEVYLNDTLNPDIFLKF